MLWYYWLLCPSPLPQLKFIYSAWVSCLYMCFIKVYKLQCFCFLASSWLLMLLLASYSCWLWKNVLGSMNVVWTMISMTVLFKGYKKNHHHPKQARLYFVIKHLTQSLRQWIHYLVASVWTVTSDCPVELTSVCDKWEFGQVPSKVSRDWHIAQESISNMGPGSCRERNCATKGTFTWQSY